MPFKNLKVIRGKTFVEGTQHSVYIERNENLKYLNFTNLVKIQNGNIFIGNNPKLCHLEEVRWKEILSKNSTNLFQNNAVSSTCQNCCLPEKSNDYNKCTCWFQNINKNCKLDKNSNFG